MKMPFQWLKLARLHWLLSMYASPDDQWCFWSWFMKAKTLKELLIDIELYFQLWLRPLKKLSSVKGFCHKWDHKCFSGLLPFILRVHVPLTLLYAYIAAITILTNSLRNHWVWNWSSEPNSSLVVSFLPTKNHQLRKAFATYICSRGIQKVTDNLQAPFWKAGK